MTVTVRKPKYPKYVRHVIRENFNLDSAAYIFRGDLSNPVEPVYVISDRFSPFVKGEKPKATVSIILEGNRPYQLRIAVKGDFHVENLSYYVIDPCSWVEWGWLLFPQYEISRLRRFLAHFVDLNTYLWEMM